MDRSSDLAGLGAAHRPKFFGNENMDWNELDRSNFAMDTCGTIM